MNINKEAIYSTRPWEVFGEGPIAEADIKINAQGFNEGAYSKATAQEIRFTQTKKDLYATVLAWPENGNVIIKSLAADSKLFPQRVQEGGTCSDMARYDSTAQQKGFPLICRRKSSTT